MIFYDFKIYKTDNVFWKLFDIPGNKVMFLKGHRCSYMLNSISRGLLILTRVLVMISKA